MPLLLARHGEDPWPLAVLREYDDFGITSLDLVRPSSRLWKAPQDYQSSVVSTIDRRLVQEEPTPSSLLRSISANDNWQAQGRRAISRLHAHFVVCEDWQRRLEAKEVATLAHQASLVAQILASPHLARVLIADEVGLGKTVEAGLLVQQLLESQPGLRILYLAPARLVSNVRREFDRLGLHFRQWSSSLNDARLTDSKLIASIHRAVHPDNFQRFLATPSWNVVIVDECHHLSAWGPDGTDPTQSFKLVRELVARVPEDGRIILMSGTPHQGNEERFNNLLGLLRRPNEKLDDIHGR